MLKRYYTFTADGAGHVTHIMTDNSMAYALGMLNIQGITGRVKEVRRSRYLAEYRKLRKLYATIY